MASPPGFQSLDPYPSQLTGSMSFRCSLIIFLSQFWINEKRPLCCFSESGSLQRDGYENGIQSGFGYPVTDFFELSETSGTLRLLEIMQPYADAAIPRCTFFDVSALSHVKSPRPKESPCCFWISFEDWCREFTSGEMNQALYSLFSTSTVAVAHHCFLQSATASFFLKVGNQRACTVLLMVTYSRIFELCFNHLMAGDLLSN